VGPHTVGLGPEGQAREWSGKNKKYFYVLPKKAKWNHKTKFIKAYNFIDGPNVYWVCGTRKGYKIKEIKKVYTEVEYKLKMLEK